MLRRKRAQCQHNCPYRLDDSIYSGMDWRDRWIDWRQTHHSLTGWIRVYKSYVSTVRPFLLFYHHGLFLCCFDWFKNNIYVCTYVCTYVCYVTMHNIHLPIYVFVHIYLLFVLNNLVVVFFIEKVTFNEV